MLVMKFGGSSLRDESTFDAVTGIVRSRMRYRPAIVVSALSGVTDQLLAAGDSALRGLVAEAAEQVGSLRQRHLQFAEDVLGEDTARGMRLKLEPQFQELERFVTGIAAVRELSPRSRDYLLSFGEIFSSQIVAAALSRRGYPVRWLDSRDFIVTDNAFTRATPDYEQTYDRMRRGLRPLLIEHTVPVMAGFIGRTEAGEVTTLGRGGGDLTAALVAAGINAARIEVWTDVDGLMTTDPELCEEARGLRRVSFREATEMANFGAKVLHPAALLPAMKKDIPVFVLNFRKPKSPGTRISSRPPRGRSQFTAIAAKPNVQLVTLSAPAESSSHRFLKEVFERLHQSACATDLVAVSELGVSFTLAPQQNCAELLKSVREVAEVVLDESNAIVCLVGENIRGRAGIAARAFTALAEAGINVRMISQGASEISLSFVVQERDMREAVRRLHASFSPKKRNPTS